MVHVLDAAARADRRRRCAPARRRRRRSARRRFSSWTCFRTRRIARCDLFPAALDAARRSGLYRFQPDPATERYPLALISPASERTISSTLGELPRPDVKLLMHPDDAQARGLADGDLVRIFNDLGEVHCPLHVAPAIRPGTVSLPKGHLAPQHAQQLDRHRARAGHADRSRRRRVLQRRARAGRVAGDSVNPCSS